MFRNIFSDWKSYIHVVNLNHFYCLLKNHVIFKQLLRREGIDEMRASIESGRSVIGDHNWSRKKVRFCVQKIGDVSVLYYRKKETGDCKRPSLRVVAVEDLWETLMGVHEQVCHGGKTRMEKYLVEHGSHVLRPVIQLFLDLCQICQATRGRKSTRKIVHKPIIPDTVGQRGQAELVDLQMVPDNGTEFSNKTLWPGLMNSGRVHRVRQATPPAGLGECGAG